MLNIIDKYVKAKLNKDLILKLDSDDLDMDVYANSDFVALWAYEGNHNHTSVKSKIMFSMNCVIPNCI